MLCRLVLDDATRCGDQSGKDFFQPYFEEFPDRTGIIEKCYVAAVLQIVMAMAPRGATHKDGGATQPADDDRVPTSLDFLSILRWFASSEAFAHMFRSPELLIEERLPDSGEGIDVAGRPALSIRRAILRKACMLLLSVCGSRRGQGNDCGHDLAAIISSEDGMLKFLSLPRPQNIFSAENFQATLLGALESLRTLHQQSLTAIPKSAVIGGCASLRLLDSNFARICHGGLQISFCSIPWAQISAVHATMKSNLRLCA